MGDILYTVTGSYGIPIYIDFDHKFCFQRHIALIRPNLRIFDKYLFYMLSSSLVLQQADHAATGVAQKTVSLGLLRQFSIPLPSIDVQRRIVAEIQEERKLVDANRELVERFETKIQRTIDRVWSEGGSR